MHWPKVLLFSIVVLLTGGALHADAIRLTSGQVIDGKILEESQTVVVMQTAKGVFAFERADIVEIEKGGSPKIARVPDTRIDPWTGALMSLIPGSSGLYKTEYTGAGVPFAMGQMLLAYRIAKTTFWKSPRGFLESPLAGDTGGNFFMITVAASRNIQACQPSCTQANIDLSAALNNYGWYYAGHSWFATSYAVGKRIYTVDQMRNVRKNSIAQYAGVAALNAAASYFVLSRMSASAANADAGNGSGIPTFSAYILPVGRRDVAFGVVTAF